MSSLDALIESAGERWTDHAPLGARTTYRVGGRARGLVTLASNADVEELMPLVEACGRPWVVIGNGSNLLVADGDHDLIAVTLTGQLADSSWRDDDGVRVEAGAGADLPVLARRLSADGVTGFEWAVGVPGTVGGAAVMNAGGHGSDMAASVRSVTTWSHGWREWGPDELSFGYRTSALHHVLVTRVSLGLTRGDAEASRERLAEIVRWRREHQPGGANAGSVFRNPADASAGALIEAAGCKGLRIGTAEVSTKHANFIIADPDGRANDVWRVIAEVRARVAATSGVTLQLEHHVIGFEESR